MEEIEIHEFSQWAQGNLRRTMRRAMNKPESKRLYDINILYCDDVSFTHAHTVVGQATSEYAAMLREAIEPTSTEVKARHVRKVTMIVKDEDGNPLRAVDSGIFPCADRTNMEGELGIPSTTL